MADAMIGFANFKSIRSLIADKKNTTDPGDLMYIIKAGENAAFGDNINLMGEMSKCNIPPGHYTQIDISRGESDLIKVPEKDQIQ